MALTRRLVLVGIIVLDVIAFSLAAAAEHRRSKVTIAKSSDGSRNYCAYSSRISTWLGLGSFFLLLGAQVLSMVATSCLCFGNALQPGRRRVWAILLFIASWVTFLIAELCLLIGSAQNARHSHDTTPVGSPPPHCKTPWKGFFAGGATFIVVTRILSVVFFKCYLKANPEQSPSLQNQDMAIGMGEKYIY